MGELLTQLRSPDRVGLQNCLDARRAGKSCDELGRDSPLAGGKKSGAVLGRDQPFGGECGQLRHHVDDLEFGGIGEGDAERERGGKYEQRSIAKRSELLRIVRGV